MRIGRITLGIVSRQSPPPVVAGIGLFVAGYNPGILSVTDKYAFDTDVRTAGTNLVAATDGVHGMGNTVVGIFNGNQASGGVRKYTYAGDVSGTGAVLTLSPSAGAKGAGCGIASHGIITNGSSPNVTCKYTYSGDTTAAATSLTNNTGGAVAVGNSAVGIFHSGYNVLTTNKYTYSGDSVSVGASLITNHYAGGAAGDASTGIFFGGNGGTLPVNSATDKYNYSGDTVSAGTAAVIAGGSGGWQSTACGNSTRAIFGAGSNGVNYSMHASTAKYVFSGDVVSAGTSLGTARYDIGSASSSPGGF